MYIYVKLTCAPLNTLVWFRLLHRYREYEEEKKVYDNLDEAFESKTMSHLAQLSQDSVAPTRWQVWQRRLHVFLEEPMSSKLAQVSRS